MSEKDRVRELLRSSYPGGLCSITLAAIMLPSGHIGDLVHDDGLDIDTVPCDARKWHVGEEEIPDHVRYVWHFNARPGRQLPLGITREEDIHARKESPALPVAQRAEPVQEDPRARG